VIVIVEVVVHTIELVVVGRRAKGLFDDAALAQERVVGHFVMLRLRTSLDNALAGSGASRRTTTTTRCDRTRFQRGSDTL
jgi:hypothetical protein